LNIDGNMKISEWDYKYVWRNGINLFLIDWEEKMISGQGYLTIEFKVIFIVDGVG